jgi:hypothetical protein
MLCNYPSLTLLPPPPPPPHTHTHTHTHHRRQHHHRYCSTDGLRIQIADEIEGLILSHTDPVPTIVVIPSKEHA